MSSELSLSLSHTHTHTHTYTMQFHTALHRHNGGQSLAVDERLLGSLVQDVWDKFCGQRALLLARQRHEAESLWLLQYQQWTDRLKDLGEPL